MTMAYATIELNPTNMVVRPVGKHRFLAVRFSLYVARADVVSAEPGGHLAENGPIGLRMPGTNVPGGYLAGTFWKFWGNNRVKSFWIRRHPGKSVRITLTNHDYNYLMLEVDDPTAEITRIEAWIRSAA